MAIILPGLVRVQILIPASVPVFHLLLLVTCLQMMRLSRTPRRKRTGFSEALQLSFPLKILDWQYFFQKTIQTPLLLHHQALRMITSKISMWRECMTLHLFWKKKMLFPRWPAEYHYRTTLITLKLVLSGQKTSFPFH